MKLGEIKLEALIMIYPGEAFNVTEENITEALEVIKGDPNYADYLAAMPGIINRCFGVLESKGVLPTKQMTLESGGQTQTGGQTPPLQIRCDLRSLAEDYGILERVAFEGAGGTCYTSECDYTRESADVILLPYMGKGKYILIYTPRLPRVGLISSEGTEVLPGRDDIASLIPYYIKSELLYTEYPEDAKLARQLFESGLSGLASHKEGHQSKVETVYRTW